MKKKVIRISTIPGSLETLLKGQLKMLSEYYEVVAVSSPGERMKVLEAREGVRTVSVPMERRISLVKDFISLLRLIVLFAKERPDIVHSITPKAGLLSMLAAWITRVPARMHTFTGLVFPTATGKMQKLLIAMDRLTCFCATHINPEGEGVKRDTLKCRFDITFLSKWHTNDNKPRVAAQGQCLGHQKGELAVSKTFLISMTKTLPLCRHSRFIVWYVRYSMFSLFNY